MLQTRARSPSHLSAPRFGCPWARSCLSKASCSVHGPGQASPSSRRVLQILRTRTRFPSLQHDPPEYDSLGRVAFTLCGVRADPLGSLHRPPALGHVIKSLREGREETCSSSPGPDHQLLSRSVGGRRGEWPLLSRLPHQRSWRNATSHLLNSPAGLNRCSRMNFLRAHCVSLL